MVRSTGALLGPFIILTIIVLFNTGTVNGLTCYRCVHGNASSCISADKAVLRPTLCLPPPHGHKAYCSVRAFRPRTQAEEKKPRRFIRGCASKNSKYGTRCRQIKKLGGRGRITVECFCESDNCNNFNLLKKRIWKFIVKSRHRSHIPQSRSTVLAKFGVETRSMSETPRKTEDRSRSSDSLWSHPPHEPVAAERYSDAKYGPHDPYGKRATSARPLTSIAKFRPIGSLSKTTKRPDNSSSGPRPDSQMEKDHLHYIAIPDILKTRNGSLSESNNNQPPYANEEDHPYPMHFISPEKPRRKEKPAGPIVTAGERAKLELQAKHEAGYQEVEDVHETYVDLNT